MGPRLRGDDTVVFPSLTAQIHVPENKMPGAKAGH